MSSIYRKGGADGYYYYQTYVYNPDTGKKDKRIFHSLGTRDLPEAEIQQAQLDKKYEQQDRPSQKNERFTFLLEHNRTIALVGCTALVTILILNLFRSDPSPRVNLNKQAAAHPETQEKAIVQPETEETTDRLKQHQTEEISPPVVSKPAVEMKQIKPKLTIPKHTVVRVERISSVFQQGKVYVTVDEQTSTQRLRLLCKSLTKQYPEFSNIVICLYTSSVVGIQLAKGIGSHFSLKEQNEAWLVLYSYNSVEGEYYDEEPGKYFVTGQK